MEEDKSEQGAKQPSHGPFLPLDDEATTDTSNAPACSKEHNTQEFSNFAGLPTIEEDEEEGFAPLPTIEEDEHETEERGRGTGRQISFFEESSWYDDGATQSTSRPSIQKRPSTPNPPSPSDRPCTPDSFGAPLTRFPSSKNPVPGYPVEMDVDTDVDQEELTWFATSDLSMYYRDGQWYEGAGHPLSPMSQAFLSDSIEENWKELPEWEKNTTTKTMMAQSIVDDLAAQRKAQRDSYRAERLLNNISKDYSSQTIAQNAQHLKDHEFVTPAGRLLSPSSIQAFKSVIDAEWDELPNHLKRDQSKRMMAKRYIDETFKFEESVRRLSDSQSSTMANASGWQRESDDDFHRRRDAFIQQMDEAPEHPRRGTRNAAGGAKKPQSWSHSPSVSSGLTAVEGVIPPTPTYKLGCGTTVKGIRGAVFAGFIPPNQDKYAKTTGREPQGAVLQVGADQPEQGDGGVQAARPSPSNTSPHGLTFVGLRRGSTLETLPSKPLLLQGVCREQATEDAGRMDFALDEASDMPM